eukprot:scaffold77630_cov30-Phaeocystis_antarctica.AAC.1
MGVLVGTSEGLQGRTVAPSGPGSSDSQRRPSCASVVQAPLIAREGCRAQAGGRLEPSVASSAAAGSSSRMASDPACAHPS